MVVTCEDMKTTAIQSQLVKIGIRHQKMTRRALGL